MYWRNPGFNDDRKSNVLENQGRYTQKLNLNLDSEEENSRLPWPGGEHEEMGVKRQMDKPTV